LNTAALMVGSDLLVSHSEENMDVNAMGMLAAVPAASKGTLTDKDAKWIVRDVQAGYGSPVSDGERIYVVDNGGVLLAFDVKDGKHLWRKNLGTIRNPRGAVTKTVCGDGKREVLHPEAARRRCGCAGRR
jgi:outer membrane protein assembly factor BamB